MPRRGRPPIAMTLVCLEVHIQGVTGNESIFIKLTRVSEVATNHWVFSNVRLVT